ncbi:TIGR02302 family protein [Plastoroseomonas arctica]|uniref:TIGR02302 family protein n=1 Tax=Plastoroseomonas arctica TaxID=1509237 RepID=A0AAF1KJH1_9PROT|nr:TIGR02302 family protein [Plastoroseomonas arctica]MBR0655140.1 TIGR02302 family protein [Plastoroseomonas arctica]
MSPEPLPPRIAWLRRAARAALLWEAVWPALWPPLAVLGVFLLVALAGVPNLLHPALHLALLAGFAGALAFAILRSARRLRWPDAADADRRIERDSRLRHLPLATLADQPAGNDPEHNAVWAAHRIRAAAQLAATRTTRPRPGLAARDPRALRAGLGVAVLAGFIIAGDSAGERLRRAFTPGFAAAALPPALRLEAWATPPAYTGAAPVFLAAGGGAVTLPAGSRLQVSVSGGVGEAPVLSLDATDIPMRALDRASYAGEAVLDSGGRLRLRREGRDIAAWTLTVQADTAPRVSFSEPPARAARGLAIRIPWRVEDDWGVVSLDGAFYLRARPGAEPHRLDIPLPGTHPRQAQGTAQPDLSAHPWAGLEVELQLTARDGAEQEGRSERVTLTLPERSFNHPVARQVIAVRRALSLDPSAREPALRALDVIAAAPEAFEEDTGTYLALRSARHRLIRDRRPVAVDETQAILWEIAIALEEGRADRTARALAAARDALREAIEQAQREDPGATPEQRAEMERRVQALREAIRRHLEAMAERLQQENAEAMPFDPRNRLMDQREVDRRSDRMRDAAREGRTEDAARELAELEEMLRNLEQGRTASPEQRQRQERQQRGRQQMGAVQDMVQRQGEMLDRGHQRQEDTDRRRGEERRSNQRQTQPQPQPQAQPQASADPAADARRQRALRRALGEMMQQFGDLTGEVPEGLGRADQAMREAGEALGEGRDARDAQGRAMRALMEGGRQMAQQMQRQGMSQEGEGEGEPQDSAGQGQPGGEGEAPGQEQGEGRDPLGRRQRENTGAQDNGSDTRVPEEAELLRTRRLQDELRRRGGERERAPAELDYIERLLRRF